MGLAKKISSNADYWTVSDIDAVKKETRSELEQYATAHGQRAKLKYIFQRVNELSESTDSDSLLRTFVYVISALIHHLRQGGLQEREIERLAHIGRNCLRLQGVVPGRSKTSFLHGELHMALSQVFAHEGNLWRASWDQLVAKLATRDEPVGGIVFHELSLGRRNLRLGYGDATLRNFSTAVQHAIGEEQQILCKISLAKALRLTGRRDDAASIVADLLRCEALTDEQRVELEWEVAWGRLAEQKQLRELVQMVGPKGRHQSGAYVSEAKLASFAVQEREFEARFARVSTYKSRGVMTPSGLGVFFHCLVAIEDCYDKGIPSTNRLDTVANLLEQSSSIVSIEKELLFLAATARWLARSNFREFSIQVLSRYRSLSWSLSSGRNADVLGIVEDLMERDWFSLSDLPKAE